MIVGVVKETLPGERRVALVPGVLPALTKAGLEVLIEAGAGDAAGFTDGGYREKGATIADSRGEVFQKADVVAQVRTLGANPEAGQGDLEHVRDGQVIIGFADPLKDAWPAQALAERGVVLLAMELMPRITRAQSMDVLSSQATIQGYKAVLLGADHLPRMFPMMMTAAGTISPAHVFVIGAGVAGLQAIATARRLGALVSAYDIRPVVKEQCESLGARFLELELETGGSEDKGGYAKAMDEEFYRKQQELMGGAVAEHDVVITTAAVPGKKSPILVTADHVQHMRPGSVIVDLAAEHGGNCELTQPDETVEVHGVKILGPTNLPATVPFHASQMYAKNVVTFLLHLVKEEELQIDLEDEITEGTLLTRDGKIVNRRVREILKLDDGAEEESEHAEVVAEETGVDGGSDA
jgi:NAD(P) transhydrogenase subunit alpha